MDYIRMGIEVPVEVQQKAQEEYLRRTPIISVLEDHEQSPPPKNPFYHEGEKLPY
jgi:hypothetical protein